MTILTKAEQSYCQILVCPTIGIHTEAYGFLLNQPMDDFRGVKTQVKGCR